MPEEDENCGGAAGTEASGGGGGMVEDEPCPVFFFFFFEGFCYFRCLCFIKRMNKHTPLTTLDRLITPPGHGMSVELPTMVERVTDFTRAARWVSILLFPFSVHFEP